MTSARSGGRMQASLGELIRTLPARQLWLLWLAIFSTFATIAFMIDIVIGGRFPVAWLTSTAPVSGALSVGFTATSLRRRWLALASLIAADIVYVVIARRVFELLPVAPEGRFIVDAIGALVCISIGYTLFILFMNATATRHLRAQAELAVAHDIHQVLVPSIDRTIGEYEFLGWSIASGEVGGDLVDLVAIDGRWLGYVADVSGHGVGAGIVHGNVQECAPHPGSHWRREHDAARRCAGGTHAAEATEHVRDRGMGWPWHGRRSRMRGRRPSPDPARTRRCGGRDHPPAICARHVRGRGIHLDAGRVPGGDVLALLTDGLVEVFDSAGRELGFEWAKKTLATVADRTLQETADHLLTGARNHGAQLDDQSLLLIRRTSRP